MPLLSVAKFGGTSVADFPSMQACADILAADPHSRVVVLSASAGVTNLLVALANGCGQDKREKLFAEVVRIQENILTELSHADVIRPYVEEHLTKIKELADVIADSAPSLMLTDELISRGEMMSSLIFVHLLRERGVDAEWVDVRTIVRTNNHFGKAIPDEVVTKTNVETHINPLLQVGKIVVTQGFIGRDKEGHTTTLGRGGSDYSAALLAGVLGAKDVLIWTDVAGIYTTDPRMVPLAYRIDSLTFEEAAEMATFGAKVLHPATLRPAVRSNIPVYVGSSKAPNAGGTWVTKKTTHTPTFRAIAVRHEQTLLTLSRLNMSQESGFLNKILSILEKYNIVVDTVNASDLSVTLVLDKIGTGCSCSQQATFSEKLLADLSAIANVKVDTGLSLVALVGNKLDNHPGLAKDIFTVLADFNIRMISYGTSTNNICLLVQTDQATDIVRALHKNLFEN